MQFAEDRTATYPGQGADQPWPTIHGYELEAVLGEGGGGRVFRARQLGADREVAVKVLSGGSPAEQARFAREVRALAAIRHPHVIPIFEVGHCAVGPFFSMELATRGNLGQRVRGGGLNPREAASLVEQAARGVAAAHAARIIHRDLKPGNILLAHTDLGEVVPKVADFGLAKPWTEAGDAPDGLVTATGAFLGTPSYMAPEQAAGRVADIGVRTDVYGLGAVLYHALTGSPPFRGDSAAAVAHQVITAPPEPPRRRVPGIPRDLEAVCLKCLEKAPARRYATPDEFADDLSRFLKNEATQVRPTSAPTRFLRWGIRNQRTIGVGALLAIVAVVAGAIVWGLTRPEDPEAELRRIRAELKANQKVTLVKTEGLPRWSRWERGGGTFRETGYGDRVCSFEAVESAYLELLPSQDVPESFHLRAEVRHEEGVNATSRAGVYFFHQKETHSNANTISHWHQVCFNDHPPLAVGGMKQPPDLMQYRPAAMRVVPGQAGREYFSNSATLTFVPPPPLQDRPWRVLEIEVTRAGVRVKGGTEGEELRPFSRNPVPMESLEETSIKIRDQARDGGADANHPNNWVPRGSLGLFLTRGRGSFRNVEIEPLSP
jgi:serine/threonine-protein kinase